MTTSLSDDFITGQGAGWRAGYHAGVMAERQSTGTRLENESTGFSITFPRITQ